MTTVRGDMLHRESRLFSCFLLESMLLLLCIVVLPFVLCRGDTTVKKLYFVRYGINGERRCGGAHGTDGERRMLT